MRKCILLFIVSLLCLTGCKTVEANRIYTVCQIEDGISIAYNPDMEFVQVVDGKILPHSGAGVTAKPVLTFHPSSGDYVITATDTPHLYHSTLESLEHYIFYLLQDDAELKIDFISWRELDIYVHSPTWHCRCIWNIDGSLRLYFIDNYSNALPPLYINEEM